MAKGGKKKGARATTQSPWTWFESLSAILDFDDSGCARLYLDGDVVLVLRAAQLTGEDSVKGTLETARDGRIIHRHQFHSMASSRSRKDLRCDLGKKGVTLSDEALADLETKARERLAESQRLADEQKSAGSAGSTGAENPHVIQVGRYAGTTNPADPGLFVARDAGQKRLTNFCTRITAQEFEDDGVHEPQRHFVLESIVPGGAQVPCTIPASEFKGLTWVLPRLGAQAVIYPTQTTRDETVVAIQMISQASGPIPVHRIFTHTGWRRIGKIWHYLHGDGAITASGAVTDVTVRLPDDLAPFRLPVPPVGVAAVVAVRASLNLFTLAPYRVMAPVLGGIYLAPLIEPLGNLAPDFVPWFFGDSQKFKSTIAALGQGHFGPFTRTTMPAEFRDTWAALELKLCAMKDAPMTIDDYKTATTAVEQQDMDRNAARLARTVGNRRGRARATAHMKVRESYPPRGLALATGERLPAGSSTLARLFAVPVRAGDVTIDRVNTAQQASARYPEAMAAYIQWIAANMDTLGERLPRRFEELRAGAMTAGDPPREPGQVAHLQLGIEVFTVFAIEIGALDVTAAEALRAQSWHALLTLGGEHGADLAAQRPTARFLALLGAGFGSRRIYLEAKEGGRLGLRDAERYGWAYVQAGDDQYEWRHEPHGQLLGWLDADHLLLNPEETYKYIVSAAATARETFSTDKATLLRLLDEEHLIETQEEKRGEKTITRREVVARAGGKLQRVVKLCAAALDPDVTTAAPGGNGRARPEPPSDQDLGDGVTTLPPLPSFTHEGGQERRGVCASREPGEDG